jgi:uncharacterized membrane protein YbhN (UPF0104 family)
LRRPPKKTTVAVTLVIVFHLALFFQFTAPDRRMPSFILNLVAFADAAFVASVVQFILDDWGARRGRLRLPGGRSVGVATLASAAAFALVAAMWFSPWAPIKAAPAESAGDAAQRVAPHSK